MTDAEKWEDLLGRRLYSATMAESAANLEEMPTWDELDDEIRRGWIEIAVMRRLVADQAV